MFATSHHFKGLSLKDSQERKGSHENYGSLYILHDAAGVTEALRQKICALVVIGGKYLTSMSKAKCVHRRCSFLLARQANVWTVEVSESIRKYPKEAIPSCHRAVGPR